MYKTIRKNQKLYKDITESERTWFVFSLGNCFCGDQTCSQEWINKELNECNWTKLQVDLEKPFVHLKVRVHSNLWFTSSDNLNIVKGRLV